VGGGGRRGLRGSRSRGGRPTPMSRGGRPNSMSRGGRPNSASRPSSVPRASRHRPGSGPARIPASAPARRPRRRQCNDRTVTANQVTAQDEVVDICRDLIRIDTSNPGDHSGPGERQAAEYVAAKLAEVGLEPTVLESHPKRTSVVTRIKGRDESRPALLVHGHLDVVPANAPDWQYDPFSGEFADGCLWGRGAIDMKDMDAMMLAVFRQRLREQRKPARDVVLTFTADEE